MFRTILLSVPILLAACGSTEEAKDAEALAADKCPKVHLDRLAGDWVKVEGASADGKTRLRIVPEGEGYEAFYVGGFLTYLAMQGERRDNDVVFTEVADAEQLARVEAGEATLTRLFVEPSYETCSLKVYSGKVGAGDKEQVDPRAMEFLEFPDMGVTFSYQPADAPLFLGDAARDRATAEAQVDELGEPKADHPMGTVPVGLWTRAEADGPDDCTYTMDLFFDGKAVEGQQGLAAGEVTDGWRHWFHEWQAPHSGNHLFEFHRYRTCEGGDREPIGIAAVEAVLL